MRRRFRGAGGASRPAAIKLLRRNALALTIEEEGAVRVVREWAANRGEAALVPRKAGEAGAMSIGGLRRIVEFRADTT